MSVRAKAEFGRHILLHVGLILTSLLIILPLLVMISSAFKNEVEIFAYPISLLPRPFRLINFSRLTMFPLYILNSIKVTLGIAIIQLFTATTAAYAFAKLNWKGKEFLFLLYIGSMMIPVQAIIIPQFIIVRKLGLYDSHFALISIASFTAFGTFLLKQYFMTIPDSLLEAARIDGASELYIFTRIMLPLSKPALVVLVVFSFRYFWNDFFTPMIYLASDRLKTIPLGMSDFATQYMVYYGPQMAACVISVIPVLIIFVVAQKYFVEGIASGAITS